MGAGTLYRRSTGWQAYYPRVVPLSKHEFLASFVAGRGLETPDSHPELARSNDGGLTWTWEGPVDRRRTEPGAPAETGFISKAGDGSLWCVGARFEGDPTVPGYTLINLKTVGMRDNQIVLRRSTDSGRSWSPVQFIPKPVSCPLEVPAD